MKKLFTLLFALVAGVGYMFSSVQIGVLYYNLDEVNKKAEVTREPNGEKYSGDIIIPDSVTYNAETYRVTSIGMTAFADCTDLTSIKVPNSIETVGTEAFSGCTFPVYSDRLFLHLPESYNGKYVVPEGIEVICINAFSECNYLGRLTLPKSLKKIETQAFIHCSALQTIHIPENVQTIEPVACIMWDRYSEEEDKLYSNFKSFTVDENNPYFAAKDGVLFNKSMTKLICFPTGKSGEYIVPNLVDTIAPFAFYYGANVTKVTVSDHVCHISEYAFAYNISIKTIIIGNGVERIPMGCFIEDHSLQYISLGTGIKEIANDALGTDAPSTSYLPLSTIVCHAPQVPEIIKLDSMADYFFEECYYSPYKEDDKADVFVNINRNAKLYVPANLIPAYEKHFVWGEFDVQPITAESAETTDVKTTTTENSVNIVWPSVSGAETYELIIRDKNGNVICTLIFNAQGQLLSIAFNAPARGDAPQKTQTAGFSFIVTGLEAGTSYDLTITAKNEAGQELDKKNVSFHTDSAEGIEDIHIDSDKPVKVLMDGRIYILCGDHIFDTQGKMIK